MLLIYISGHGLIFKGEDYILTQSFSPDDLSLKRRKISIK